MLIFHILRQPGEDSKMLVCDACDKGYHTFCLQPVMDSLPSDPWKCRVSHICHSPLYMAFPLKLGVKASSHTFLRRSSQKVFKFIRTLERVFCPCYSLTICLKFYPHNLYYVRGVVFVRNVVSVDWCCQVRPSGLTTMPCVRPASVTAALRVACAASLPTQLSLCSAAACATG